MSKLTYQIVTATADTINKPNVEGVLDMINLTVTFNYNLEAKALISLISKLLEIKTFKSVELAHFEIKNGHISDYHKNTSSDRYLPIIDDMDQF